MLGTRVGALGLVLIAPITAGPFPERAEKVRAALVWEEGDRLRPLLLLIVEEIHAGEFARDDEERAAHFERAYEAAVEASRIATDPLLRDAVGPILAWRAYDAGHYDVAEAVAREILAEIDPLPDSLNTRTIGEANFGAHSVLGLLALRDEDITTALEHFRATTRRGGAPVLSSFGPNMRLAKALLERGQVAAVLEHFEECRTFWHSHDDELDRWAQIVRHGGIPDFGANLRRLM